MKINEIAYKRQKKTTSEKHSNKRLWNKKLKWFILKKKKHIL